MSLTHKSVENLLITVCKTTNAKPWGGQLCDEKSQRIEGYCTWRQFVIPILYIDNLYKSIRWHIHRNPTKWITRQWNVGLRKCRGTYRGWWGRGRGLAEATLHGGMKATAMGLMCWCAGRTKPRFKKTLVARKAARGTRGADTGQEPSMLSFGAWPRRGSFWTLGSEGSPQCGFWQSTLMRAAFASFSVS